MRFLDLLFWHYYCFFERNKTNKDGDSLAGARLLTAFTSCGALLLIYFIIDTFVYALDINVKSTSVRLLGLLIALLWVLYLLYRYENKKSITKNNYQLFRERWGDPLQISKKKMLLLLMYTIITTIGVFVIAATIGELKKHGMFVDCRLFP